MKLITLPIEDACREKWSAGQKIYGKDFVGHPLEHLAEELIDAVNYCDEASRKRWGYKMSTVRERLVKMYNEVQAEYFVLTPDEERNAEEYAANITAIM